MLRRTRLYDVTGAARRVDVSEWTIRRWVRDGALKPYPGSLRTYGRHMFREADVVEAEYAKRAGRTRRRDTVAA